MLYLFITPCHGYEIASVQWFFKHIKIQPPLQTLKSATDIIKFETFNVVKFCMMKDLKWLSSLESNHNIIFTGSRPSVTDRIMRRTSYAGERTDVQVGVMRTKSATSEPRLYRKNTILTRHRAVKQMKSHHSKVSGTQNSFLALAVIMTHGWLSHNDWNFIQMNFGLHNKLLEGQSAQFPLWEVGSILTKLRQLLLWRI